jgi:uncharacterized protein YkwD
MASGRPPAPTANGPLRRDAQDRAGVIGDGNCFGHGRGASPSERIDRAGYTDWTGAAENIATGHTSPEAMATARPTRRCRRAPGRRRWPGS